MKTVIKICFICSVLALCGFVLPMKAMASPATAQGENVMQVEQLLKYLSYTADGDGDKVLYIICGAQCPRCAQMYKTFENEPMFRKEFQIRWVMYPGTNVGYLFPLENKPGAGIKELYSNSQQIEPRPVEDPIRLETMVKYNGLIMHMVDGLFNGNPSVKVTPFIIIKTQEGFEYGSPEDFLQNSATASFSKALPLSEGTNIYDSGIIKTVNDAETLSRYIFCAIGKDTPLHLFPYDDAPLIAKPIPKDRCGKASSKIGNDWVGIQIYQDPEAPLAYAKRRDGKLQKK